ncbi:hypothetical protein [Nocardia suismassiliense]|uniref:hypothetical protein n=1 Tax=Nocardia suismassiliense TaxID=2077092 RepID=UPI000D1EECD9|nr:hypothetical protein [Nocardia suismassiliense]
MSDSGRAQQLGEPLTDASDIAFTPDGKTLLTGAAQDFNALYSSNTRDARGRLPGHVEPADHGAAGYFGDTARKSRRTGLVPPPDTAMRAEDIVVR